MSDSWLDKMGGADGSENDDTTLFADNFEALVEDDEVETLNVQTIADQIEDITDPEVLADAIEVDSRDDAEEVYRDRIGDINSDNDDDDEEESSPTEETEAESTTDGEDETDDADGVDDETASEQSAASPTGEDEVDDVDETVDTSDDEESSDDGEDGGSETPDIDVNVGAIAPDAVDRETAADEENTRTLLVWGQEGVGKTHVAHTAPGPVAYLDTEGKADEIADKFDEDVFYFQPSNYGEAVDHMEQAFKLLGEYREAGRTGTIVVDSITRMWFWAKQDYQELAFPSADGPADVDFKSALQGEDDWSQIKRRHNTNFRQRIIESPFNVVFTASAKEDYNAVLDGADGKPMVPDGEKDNPYVVKDVVRLRADNNGKTVADLHKAAKTRRSFIGVEWPEWDDIYAAIERIGDAEKSDESVDVSSWPFEVVDGKPTYIDASEDDDE